MDGETWFWILFFAYFIGVRGLQGILDISVMMWFFFTLFVYIIVKFFWKDVLFSIAKSFFKQSSF